MKSVEDCNKKVKSNCFKFIFSQETKENKFKNKERMLKKFLIPFCFWIESKVNKKKPFILGLAGGQGTGKTTVTSIVTIILTKYFNLNVFKISIDDFYKTRKERSALSKKTHLSLVLERLYNVNTKFLDSDFGLLYAHIKRKITQRSLLLLYTNFEHITALQRQLPYLKAIAKFRENPETNHEAAIELLDAILAVAPNFNLATLAKNAIANQIPETIID